MQANTRKLTVYIAMSLDGFIAKPGDDLSFLARVEKEGEDYGYSSFYERVDTVIMGRKTYDWVYSMTGEIPHPDKKLFVCTRQAEIQKEDTSYFSGDISSLVRELKKEAGKDIFCDGGAEIVQYLRKNQLIDEWIISVIPIFLGSGVRLFDAENKEEELELLSATTFEKGLVQLHYRVNTEN
ncbi:MAG: dihydrofolate reductase family protein [Spirosomataceae bacterium]